MPRAFLLPLLGAALSLAPAPVTLAAVPPPAVQAAADAPAVAVVRQFLAARSAGSYEAAYALLSTGSRQLVTAKQFAAGNPSPPEKPGARERLPDTTFGLGHLFGDTHDTAHYTFTLVGPDPAEPAVVLVRADPPAALAGRRPAGRRPATLRLLTVGDPGARAPRIDVLGSLERTAPKETAQAADEALARIEEMRWRVGSQTNLKLLSLGVIMYAQDHGDAMPDAGKWADELLPYVKDRALFRDPAAPTGQAYGYAFNRALSHKPLSALKNPASTVLLFESTKDVRNASDTGQSVPRPGRHFGGTDFALADGHVKWFKDGAKPSFALTGK